MQGKIRILLSLFCVDIIVGTYYKKKMKENNSSKWEKMFPLYLNLLYLRTYSICGGYNYNSEDFYLIWHVITVKIQNS